MQAAIQTVRYISGMCLKAEPQPHRFLSEGRRNSYVATILDASPEKLSFVLPRTIGATSGRITDLTRWELLRPKDFALPRYFCGNGLLGNSRQQRGGSRHKKSTNSPTHCQAPHLFAAIAWGHALDPADRPDEPDHTARSPMFCGRRQPSCDDTSRTTRECHVRICERLGVKFPGPTRQKPTPNSIHNSVTK